MSEVIVATKDVSVKILNGVLNAFDKHEYYFMQGYVVPYPRTSVNEYASSSAKVEWIYSVEDNQFTLYGLQDLPVGASLPILSLEIVRDDRVAHDLTDFVETMVVIRSTDVPFFPSISQIVQAWVLHSKIVFDTRIEFAARLITTNGDTVVLELDDGRDLGLVIEESEKEAAAAAGAASEEPSPKPQPNIQEVRQMAQEAITAADNAIGRIREANAAVEDAIRG